MIKMTIINFLKNKIFSKNKFLKMDLYKTQIQLEIRKNFQNIFDLKIFKIALKFP